MIKKNKGSRSWSRVLATQAMYQLSYNKKIEISVVKKNLLKDSETRNSPDRKFFFKLLNETVKNKKVRRLEHHFGTSFWDFILGKKTEKWRRLETGCDLRKTAL